MYRSIMLSIMIMLCACTYVPAVMAEDEVIEKESVASPLVKTWNNDALPFLKGLYNSFKVDVIEKTSVWIEKTKAVKKDDSSFYDILHKLFSGDKNNETDKAE